MTCWWLLVLMVTTSYGHLFLGRRSSVRGLSAGSVYFGSPGWIWEYLFRGAGCHPFSGCSCDDSDVISSFVYFGTPQVGFMVTWFLILVSDASWSDWLWVSDVCDQSSGRSFDPVPWDAQPDQSCSHHLHHSIFIFKKKNNARKKLTRIRISFIRIIHIKIASASCISCTYHPCIADMFGRDFSP